jgi:hypothetical protein
MTRAVVVMEEGKRAESCSVAGGLLLLFLTGSVPLPQATHDSPFSANPTPSPKTE